MQSQTFVEKILGAQAGSIVFKKPDLVLTHDNSASIKGTFNKMDGKKVHNPDQLLMVLDHNAPPTSAKLATQYQTIREFAKDQSVSKFHDVGDGICHQIMADHAKPGMIIVGSDSHTCTAGAFNTLAAGIDRTEAAGIWRRGETWFRVPDTIKITLTGEMPEGVYAKDLSLHIIGVIGSAGANYMSIEYHGDGVKTLSISDRMTIANLASEMGAKNAVFPPDETLKEYIGDLKNSVWSDENASYAQEMTINLSELFPLTAAPHNVDNVKAVAKVAGKPIQQALIGTCTNGRIEDLRIAAKVLKGKKVHKDVQLLVAPASKKIYLQAIKEGVITDLIESGANILGASCGPCLGTGQGIPADGYRVISTANRNFKGRMGNKEAEIFLASPATVAFSALSGKITDPRVTPGDESFGYVKEEGNTIEIEPNDNRKTNEVWNYADADNLNTDQMFAGNLTYNIMSSDPEAIMEHLFTGFDENFAKNVAQNDIIVAGENFGCGSSREHPAVGLAHAGVKAVIVKSVNRIFYRSCINQGLLLIVNKNIVDAYQPGDKIDTNLEKGKVVVGNKEFDIPPLPEKLMEIIKNKGLVNWIKTQN
ncbi:MAG: aconitase/3-isopropylmalate dehydratase large subunit family protein [Salinivirgaceae bacterium]|jgi:3-isopropylmalate/(R)-2-methylmalate dehydratase large subunit|nr:aconitase/3-isopropylmalate dehydratase large subunit family protein [Salinivirgaceae bacterium]